MGSFVRSILVEDADGAQFQLHEYLVSKSFFGLARKVKRFELDTGEQAQCIDEDTFALIATGERLRRVRE